jgi:uncharacterized membrane protein
MDAERTDAEPGTGRVEAFSDGVFAIAITLLVLEIRVPEDTEHLLRELGNLWSSFLAYGISFLLIGLIWANHHAMFDHIRRSDRMLLFLNTLLLMNVAFLPFVTAVLAAALRNGTGARSAVVLYGLALVVGGIFFNAIWEYARYRHQLLGQSIDPGGARAVSRRFLLGPLLYAVGAGIGALFPFAAIVLFASLILFYWLPVSAGVPGAVLRRRGSPRWE